jgi:hypothetical protein
MRRGLFFCCAWRLAFRELAAKHRHAHPSSGMSPSSERNELANVFGDPAQNVPKVQYSVFDESVLIAGPRSAEDGSGYTASGSRFDEGETPGANASLNPCDW